VIVDTSALVAVIDDEADGDRYLTAMLDNPATMSAAGYLEAGIVVDGRRNPILGRKLDGLLVAVSMTIEPFTPEQARIARQAYRDFGRGSGHPAKLNFGDCFSYALASVMGEPLLYKGDDFVHTDLRSALDPPPA
jgi:ribonuclease VapC